ncbi:unnamed protein product [Owenia fusiformis]|uniref:Tetratricopeptide repeat protein 38 n=1 Tax=Owenia fusiformis TaxID=6347 RepID=A0A8J1UH99_OWEFU|nr:unnamed protein product [Owenia fusiformis]
MHKNWRDCQAWRDIGLPLSTTSNEAAKLYDAAVTQIVGYYDDSSVGGLEATLKRMLECDPDFVMGHVLKNKFQATPWTAKHDAHIKKDLDYLFSLTDKPNTTDRERGHIEAIKHAVVDHPYDAYASYDNILVDHPNDIFALHSSFMGYLHIGPSTQIKDTVGRVLGSWKKSDIHYGYVSSLYAFGLEECNMYDRAEKTVLQALEMNKNDTWGSHTLCHIYEMTGRHDEGAEFMLKTESDWWMGSNFRCHNTWHWALFYVEKGEYENALSLYDRTIGKSAIGPLSSPFPITDAVSLLHRLEILGVNVGDRWEELKRKCEDHIDDHMWPFADAHFMFAFIRDKASKSGQGLLESIKAYVRDSDLKDGHNAKVYRDIGLPIYEAINAYGDGLYGEAVDLIAPKRYEVAKFGGSHAQRDVFSLFLIDAALRSSETRHHKLARSLLRERKANKPCSPFSDKLVARLMDLHDD